MACEGLDIRPELPEDAAAIVSLYDLVFGPGRFARSACLLREHSHFDKRLGFVVLAAGRVVGSIRYTPVWVGKQPAALLGPLVIAPGQEGKRCGIHLMSMTLESAKMRGYRLVFLVGDLEYYQKVGFQRVPAGQIRLNIPFDFQRFLVKELQRGALVETAGVIDVTKSQT